MELGMEKRAFSRINRKVYYALKYSLTLAVLGLIVASALR
jgi:hypothetical protein